MLELQIYPSPSRRRRMAFLLLFLLMAGFSPLLAQNCEAYYPVEPGTVMALTSYNPKGKAEARNVQTVLDRQEVDGGITARIKSEHFDKKDNPSLTQEFEVRCSGGTFTIDMESMMSPETFASYESMEVELETDELVFPAESAVGTQLPDATLVARISSNGMNVMTINIHVTDRKVEARESVTTPAGTFECLKFSQRVETKMMIRMETSSIDWYAPGVGVVRSEAYNKSGKLTGYTELTGFRKP